MRRSLVKRIRWDGVGCEEGFEPGERKSGKQEWEIVLKFIARPGRWRQRAARDRKPV